MAEPQSRNDIPAWVLLRQVPLREVIQAPAEIRGPLLIGLLGSDPARWAAFEAATEARSIDRNHRIGYEPFGTVLDLVDAASTSGSLG